MYDSLNSATNMRTHVTRCAEGGSAGQSVSKCRQFRGIQTTGEGMLLLIQPNRDDNNYYSSAILHELKKKIG